MTPIHMISDKLFADIKERAHKLQAICDDHELLQYVAISKRPLLYDDERSLEFRERYVRKGAHTIEEFAVAYLAEIEDEIEFILENQEAEKETESVDGMLVLEHMTA